MRAHYPEFLKTKNPVFRFFEKLPTKERRMMFVNTIKQHCPHATIEQVLQEASLADSAFIAERNMRAGDCLHIFFRGDNMEEWLIKAAPPFTEEQMLALKNSLFGSRSTICLHFRNGGPARLVILGCTLDSEELTQVMTTRGGDHPVVFFNTGPTDCLDPETIRERNLVVGAAAYITAFPDTVVPGIPDDARHPTHFRTQKCVSVSVAKQLRSPASPHYRSGHFRVLTSPRFTHARGKVLFIHGCFVRGKAITVKE